MLADGTIRGIGGLFQTQSLYNRSPHSHIDIRELQGRARIKKERMRSEGSDGGTWSAFWLAILGNSANFLSIFFVCDLNSCILIKTSRVRGKGQEILIPLPSLCNVSQLLSQNQANCSKSVLTKRTQWEFSLYYALLIYKNVYLLLFVHAHDHRISIESSCH